MKYSVKVETVFKFLYIHQLKNYIIVLISRGKNPKFIFKQASIGKVLYLLKKQPALQKHIFFSYKNWKKSVLLEVEMSYF